MICQWINELERSKKEEIVASLKVLSQQLPQGNEESYKISVGTAGALSVIQTGHFLNAGQKHYHLGKLSR
jgi:hypothetical protein